MGNLSTPAPAGRYDLHTYEYVLRETASRFQPELVMIAAGFDAYECDPQSKPGLHEHDFARMTRLIFASYPLR